jgi:Ca2+-binding EF-hand superfamily protein
VETIFSAFDTNNDGKLQASELRQVIQTAVQSEFAVADTNRDGQLSPSEVNAAIAGLGRQIAQSAFQKADTDNDGQISQAAFEKALAEPIRVAFSVADLNHDGKISQQEAQTARQVLASKLRSMALPEPANSPRNEINRALGNATQPAQSSRTPAPPSAPR